MSGASKEAPPHSPSSPRRQTSTSTSALRFSPNASVKRRKRKGSGGKLAVSALSVLATDASLLATTASDSTLLPKEKAKEAPAERETATENEKDESEHTSDDEVVDDVQGLDISAFHRNINVEESILEKDSFFRILVAVLFLFDAGYCIE